MSGLISRFSLRLSISISICRLNPQRNPLVFSVKKFAPDYEEQLT